MNPSVFSNLGLRGKGPARVDFALRGKSQRGKSQRLVLHRGSPAIRPDYNALSLIFNQDSTSKVRSHVGRISAVPCGETNFVETPPADLAPIPTTTSGILDTNDLPVESSMGSETEAEVEQLRETIEHLTNANQTLQLEMERVIGGLQDIVIGAKKVHHRRDRNGSGVGSASCPSSAPTTFLPQAPPAHSSSNTTSSCVVQHPGALCCTTTEIHQAPDGDSVTIRVETTARATENAAASGAVGGDALIVLANQALVGATVEQLRASSRGVREHPLGLDAEIIHKELCRILGRGAIVNAARNPVTSQFGHESFVVQLYDVATGRHLRAIFKPRVAGDADGWHRAPMELVAYKLNLLLGLDYVPPVAYRTGGISLCLEGEEHVHYQEGAMMYWVDSAKPLNALPESQWGVSKEGLLSDTRVLDVLLHNSDRHHGHFLMGCHWCDGTMKPALIDHAASFRYGADVTMTHENAFQTGPVCCVRASTYLRLRFLDCPTLLAEFSGILSEAEIRGMARRRDAILVYLDDLVKERGFGTVVKS